MSKHVPQARFLDALDAYRRQYGCASVPARYRTPDGYGLGARAWTLRAYRRWGRLSATQIAQLDAHGFIWEPRHQSVLAALECVMADASTVSSGRCATYLRRARAAGRLRPEEIAQLDAAGFAWQWRNHTLNDILARTDDFVAVKGCLPNSRSPQAEERHLASRLRYFRQMLLSQRLSPEQAAVLRPVFLAADRASL